MSQNLSLLPDHEKNLIEIEKQAAFIVWKIKEAKAGPEAIDSQLATLSVQTEQEHFLSCIAKYKTQMGVV